jgi:hypothetical protein
MRTVKIKTLEGIVPISENALDMTKSLNYSKEGNKLFGYFDVEPLLKFKYIRRGGGYRNDTNQINISISIPKNMTDEQLDYAVEEILSVVQLLKSHKGYKSISISEDTLGEYGCYGLEILENMVRIIIWRYGVKSTVYEAVDLKTALKQISKKYYRTPWDDEETTKGDE